MSSPDVAVGADGADGADGASAGTSLTTGGLPSNAPSAEVIQAAGAGGSSADEGITSFGLTASRPHGPGDRRGPTRTDEDPDDTPDGPVIWGLDTEGEVVRCVSSDEPTEGGLLLHDNRDETGGEEQSSRAVAYEVDRDALSARQTFEAVDAEDTTALGAVDGLDGGTALVTAGGPGRDETARLCEVDDRFETVWGLALPTTSVHRSERMPWSAVDRAS